MNVFRGEGNFNIFNSVKLANGKTLKDALEEATTKIENGKWMQDDIDKFIKELLIEKPVTQERFMSTAIIPEDTKKYAKKVLWHLDVPKGTKASFIESYNVERASESEILLQKGSKLFLKKANYDTANHRWNIWATVRQELKI